MTATDAIDWQSMAEFTESYWENSALPSLSEYIKIPALSPAFDVEWENNGHLDATIDHFLGWLATIEIKGLTASVHKIVGRTPLLLLKVEGSGKGNVLFYSHLDKQPEFTGWDEGKGPWLPVREDPWLYGRGSVDDGYGGYCSLISLMALQAQGIAHPSCTFILETCEESGSPDLPFYLEELTDELGIPDMVVVLDSGLGDYERVWVTESLRGLVGGTLTVAVTSEGVHSGMSSGIIPSSFRIARQILSRLEDENTGEILPDWLHIDITDQLRADSAAIVEVLGDALITDFPFLEGVQSQHEDLVEALLAQNWRPTLSITGADGIPAIANAGNVLRTHTTLKLSVRIPPGVDAESASEKLQDLLQSNPPLGAHVTFKPEAAANGFAAPPMPANIDAAFDEASKKTFGAGSMPFYEGGTIPFLAMMQESYPKASFLVTGCAGPGNNAHGPNEKLHIPTLKSLTQCVAAALASMSYG
ncbi:MAG: M20/M25/M40 family metallo-hydrolase [Euryarchaeota archaeon]|jgi:acetylornithine deacetylase/succinyl-diaminopimelate desuccinylase-like protein|nr:M20/M25/M40 family metallo-hydrolase [Euryarchaeota archaeon]